MKLVFMGTPDFAVPVLEKLIAEGHEVGYVVTQPDRARNRNKITFSPVKEAAVSHEIPVLQPEKLSQDEECKEALKAYAPDAMIVVAYGQILKQDLLELPKYGCFNVHGSLLPKLRGAAPMQQAILQGDAETGVTIMKMGIGLDDGDMVAKAATPIGNKNFLEIHDELSEMGATLMVETLPSIVDGTAVYTPQKEEEATYAARLVKQDGKIDFSVGPQKIVQKIKAFDPWPGAFCSMEGKNVKIWNGEALDKKTEAADGTVVDTDKESIYVASCGNILRITELQMPGKKRTKAGDFLRGHKLPQGTILE